MMGMPDWFIGCLLIGLATLVNVWAIARLRRWVYRLASLVMELSYRVDKVEGKENAP